MLNLYQNVLTNLFKAYLIYFLVNSFVLSVKYVQDIDVYMYSTNWVYN